MTRSFLFMAVFSLLLTGCSDGFENFSQAGPQPENPLVSGPVEGPGAIWLSSTRALNLEDVGYMQQEYFLTGTGISYINVNELQEDGLWEVQEAEMADYRTRIVVYRPIDAANFSGTVAVEWLNVSGGLDAAPDWNMLHTELIRQGHAWVGVSAQFTGVEGGTGLFDLSLKTVNPARYGELDHPGDSFSYEMFSQAVQAVRNPRGLEPLGGLRADTVIAIGQSQSAWRLMTYVDAFARRYGVIDGYLVHARIGGGAPLSQAPQADVPAPGVLRIREDVGLPVLIFQAETDLTILRSIEDRQPDSASFRQWEVAGTSHGDVYSLLDSNSDAGDDPAVAVVREVSDPIPGFISCDLPVNAGPQHWVLKAGFRGLLNWVVSGRPMPSGPLLRNLEDGSGYELDALGNALGGIRTPYVDVPVAVLSGQGQTGGGFCGLFGTTALFDAATFFSLYPTETDYVDAVSASLEEAVEAGFILEDDRELIEKGANLQYEGFVP